MTCCCHDKSVEEETFEYLLGPKTHAISADELGIYNDVRLSNVWAVENKKEFTTHSDPNKVQLFKPMKTFPKVVFRQSYRQWKAGMDSAFKLREIKKRKVICIQPLDDFPDFVHQFKMGNVFGFMEFLKLVCEIFFHGFEVRLLPPLCIQEAGWNITSRTHEKTKQKQYLVTDLQKHLKNIVPKDACSVVGISWTDLYPKESLNFCLGNANAGLFSAVLCFGRFEPKKFKDGDQPLINEMSGALIWRMMKVITHEECHILGIAHCAFFECMMNESSSLDEAMGQPFFLCPVCLRKVQKMAKFGLKDRYLKLLSLFQSLSAAYDDLYFTDSVEWLKCALSRFE